MAVYTEIGDDELRAFVGAYDIGEVLSCKGIAEGVENSNFLLTTEHGNFILDVRFGEIGKSLERDIKAIPGVIESGLFIGRDVEIVVA